MNPEKKRNLQETKQAESNQKDKPANNNNIHKRLTNFSIAIIATIALFILIVLRLTCRYHSASSCPIQMGPEQWLIVIFALIIITIIIIIKDRK